MERRRQIEVAAIEAVVSKLEKMGYAITSVEKDNVGYDLEASRGDEILHVEVKGRSGPDVCADLSANEFDCLKQHERKPKEHEHYRVAIVTTALDSPVINEFVLVRGRKLEWCTLDGRWRLEFEDRTAARLTAVPYSDDSTE